jgi:hypothetical protein
MGGDAGSVDGPSTHRSIGIAEEGRNRRQRIPAATNAQNFYSKSL